MCCFCGETIKRVGPDPTSVLVTAGWSGPLEFQADQTFWSHLDCLGERLKAPAQLYVRDIWESKVSAKS